MTLSDLKYEGSTVGYCQLSWLLVCVDVLRSGEKTAEQDDKKADNGKVGRLSPLLRAISSAASEDDPDFRLPPLARILVPILKAAIPAVIKAGSSLMSQNNRPQRPTKTGPSTGDLTVQEFMKDNSQPGLQLPKDNFDVNRFFETPLITWKLPAHRPMRPAINLNKWFD